MDNAAKELWQKAIHELEHLNRTLNSFLKITHRPRQQDSQTNENADKANGENDSCGGEVLASLHLGPTPKSTNQPDKKWYQTFQGWKSRIELMAFLFAIGYALVTYFQWRDSQNNFLVDERSWLMVDTPTGIPKNEPLDITIPVRNTGKTPAKNIRIRFDALPLDAAQPRFVFTGVPVALGPISPGGIHTFRSGPGMVLMSPPDKLFYVYGSIAYDDIFSKRHWITYCFVAAKDGYSYCQQHNDFGDGEPPQDPSVPESDFGFR